ncbi:signal recognition particle 9 kDa protein isoform X1 [Amaranthus tricolor]|uniref:signal recognition particle 9 kDa protein isoform X1 n=1 Tax=Amaranthus tricolor TaxID=29722 RepID=UPI00258B6093|nr:signal recognition particle 9 kDa protein isoform X1 [Amaranthus tricolor]
MVYLTSWDEFVERSVQLFRADPESTRYSMKYRHCDGKLVLKVTDNKECLKFPFSFHQHHDGVCVSSLKFTLLINGIIVGYFLSKRGLRRGDRLSSLLVVLCMEYFTHIMNMLTILLGYSSILCVKS